MSIRAHKPLLMLLLRLIIDTFNGVFFFGKVKLMPLLYYSAEQPPMFQEFLDDWSFVPVRLRCYHARSFLHSPLSIAECSLSYGKLEKKIKAHLRVVGAYLFGLFLGKLFRFVTSWISRYVQLTLGYI